MAWSSVWQLVQTRVSSVLPGPSGKAEVWAKAGVKAVARAATLAKEHNTDIRPLRAAWSGFERGSAG